jgi:endoglucanase
MRRRHSTTIQLGATWPIVAIGVALSLLVTASSARVLTPPPETPAIRTPVSRPAVAAPTTSASPCAEAPASPSNEGEILGTHVGYWHTCGIRIVDAAGQPVHIAGIAWAGMEGPGGAPAGLDQQSYRVILQTVRAMGYNVVRIPFSSDAIQPGHYPHGIDPRLNPDLVGLSSLEVLDRIVAECGRLGLRVVLDRHRITPWAVPSLWFDAGHSEDQWVADWVRLARHYEGNPTVVAVDLQNEPYGATWGMGDPRIDWRRAATRAGNAVLDANPNLLVFVEGIGTYGALQTYWYGGELRGVEFRPITLNHPRRLVYSPHEYGPSVYPETWFSSPQFPSNLPSVWNHHWGFIVQQAIAPVVVGELGAPQVGYDAGGTWQRAFLSFLDQQHIGFIAWALNPGMTDTGSVFNPNWHTVDGARETLYAPYLHR